MIGAKENKIEDTKYRKNCNLKGANNIKMLLIENPCIINNREVMTLNDIVPVDADERGGAAASKDENIVKGSINDMIRE